LAAGRVVQRNGRREGDQKQRKLGFHIRFSNSIGSTGICCDAISNS
jgi:hypothetical protein